MLRWRWWRWVAQVGLLLAEGLALGVAFDSGSVQSLPRGWWTPILGVSGAVMPASVAVLGAMVLVGWSQRRDQLASALPPTDPPSRYLPYLALHLAGFGALFALSSALFDGDAAGMTGAGPLVASWLVAIAITLGAWLCVLLPPRALARWVRGHASLLAGSIGLGLAAFGVGRLSQDLWLPLRRVTFAAASTLLGAVAPGTFVDPSTLTFGTDAFSVEIAPQCSGYEGVGLAWTFLLAALWLFRDRFRFPRAFILLAIATALALAANVARLVALVLVGTYLSPALAAGGFHSYAGSLLFCAIALVTVSLGFRTRWLTHAPTPDTESGTAKGNPAAAYLLPFLVMTAAGLFARAFSTEDSGPLYALRPVAGIVALLAFRHAYRVIPLRVSGWAVLVGLAVAALWLALERILPQQHAEAAQTAVGHGALALRIATAIVVAPPIEELAFRGFAARRFCAADFERIAPASLPLRGIVLAAVAFGILHNRPVAATLAGLAYGFIYRRRGQLADAVVAHGTTNLALVVVAWVTNSWDLWK